MTIPRLPIYKPIYRNEKHRFFNTLPFNFDLDNFKTWNVIWSYSNLWCLYAVDRLYNKKDLEFTKKEFNDFTSYFHKYLLVKAAETGRVYEMPYDAGNIAALTYKYKNDRFKFLDSINTPKAEEYKLKLMLSDRMPRLSYLRVRQSGKDLQLSKTDGFNMDYLKTENMKSLRKKIDIDNPSVFGSYLNKELLPKLVFIPKSAKTRQA